MKILMILSNPYKTDARVFKEANSLSSNGHDVTVIFWDRNSNHLQEDTIKKVRVIGIQNQGIMKFLRSDFLRNPFWWFKAYRKALYLYKCGFKFEVVHCHDLDTLLSGYLLKTKLNIRLIYDSHEIFGYMIEKTMPKFVSKFSFIMERILIKKVDSIITVNLPLFEFFKRIVNTDINIVMNCGEFVIDKYRSPINERFTISYFGIFDKSRMFPEAVGSLGTIEDVRFMLAGKKEGLYDTVERIAIDMVIGNVVFLGTIPHEEVIKKTLDSNVVLCMLSPNNRNNRMGLPTKVFEAMSVGRPIIVTKGLYYSELVKEEKCGILVEYDLEEVKKAIEYLRDNPRLCEELGKNGLDATKRKYNWKEQEKVLLSVYEKMK